MAIEYKWIIHQLECIPSKDGFSNIVNMIHWRYSGTDGEYSADTYGSVALETPEEDSFIDFNDLTEETVIGWIESKLEIEKLQTNINSNIDNQINPPIVSKTAPWITTPTI
jgi:hypothetical protein